MSSISALSPLSTDGAVASLAARKLEGDRDAVKAEVAVAVQKKAEEVQGAVALQVIESAVGRNLDVRA